MIESSGNNTITCHFCSQEFKAKDDVSELICPYCQKVQVAKYTGQKSIDETAVTRTSTNNNENSLIGKTIGKCEIRKKIGEGGMGAVYLAHHSTLNIPVAVKVLNPELLDKANYIERFYREAHTAAKMNHPNIVRVYDCGEENNVLYITMEYIEGGNVKERLKDSGRLSLESVMTIAKDISLALSEAEKYHTIHRDIKPENIMVTPDGRYKLADLGLAKQVMKGDDSDLAITIESVSMGTPLYMPPEQYIDAKNCDVRSDIYALGATLYHLSCGKPPFASDTKFGLYKHHAETPVTPPTDLNIHLPPKLEMVICKCMEKDPNKRYQSPQELLKDLETIHIAKSQETHSVKELDKTIPLQSDTKASSFRAGKRSNMGIYLVIGGCLGTTIITVLAPILFFVYMFQSCASLFGPLEGADVSITYPSEIQKEQTFDIEITVKNTRSGEDLKVSDISIDNSYLDGFTLCSTKPESKSESLVEKTVFDDKPKDGSTKSTNHDTTSKTVVTGIQYNFYQTLKPGQSQVFIFTLKAAKPGKFVGELHIREKKSLKKLIHTTVVE